MPAAAMAWGYIIPQLYVNLQLYKINVNSTAVERNAANIRERSCVLLTDKLLDEFEMTHGSKARHYAE
jgi:hypothetical protein